MVKRTPNVTAAQKILGVVEVVEQSTLGVVQRRHVDDRYH